VKGSRKSVSRHAATANDYESQRISYAKFVPKEKKKAHKKNCHEKRPRNSKQAMVEDVDESSSDGEEIAPPNSRLVRTANKSNNTRTNELLRILELTAAALASVGGPEEFEALFQASGSVDEETIGKIRKSCLDIIRLLPVSKSADSFSPNEVPSTIDLYDQSFVLRASSNVLYLLRPVDVFKGNKIYNRRKVFGYVRAKGSTSALISALPGWFKCVESHPRLLDSKLWTEVVKPFVNFHNYTFSTAPFDAHHGREKGDTLATHVEPRLMMWFAIHELQKRTGKVGSPLEQRGDVWELKDLIREKVEAEIVLSRPPCRHCLKFQEWFQRYQPIRFSFIVCKNLGEVRFTKDKHGQVSLPLFADGIVDLSDAATESESNSDADTEMEPQPQQEIVDRSPRIKRRSNIAVVIRQKSTPRIPRVASPPAIEAVEPTPSEVSVSTTMMARNSGGMSITTHLRQFYNTPPDSRAPKRRRNRDYFGSSDEDYRSPPARPRSRVRRESMATPQSMHNVTRNPDSVPFGSGAIQRARQFKLKRKDDDEMDRSPTVAKKVRMSKG